jgi:hypothetical protein
MSVRRLSVTQVLHLIEGAEMVAAATGLSISEVVNLVLSEPPEDARDEEGQEEAALRAGGK